MKIAYILAAVVIAAVAKALMTLLFDWLNDRW